MGRLLQSTHGEFEPWTGGRPLYDWSGLDTTWVTKSKSPNQLHPSSSSGAQKSYNYRQKGLKTSFDRGSDLSVFQTALLKKLQIQAWTPLRTCRILRIQRTWSVFFSITQVSRLIPFENMPSALCRCMISTTTPTTVRQSRVP
jgi:hypothetical protein